MKTKLFFKVAILMFNILIAQGYIHCSQCGKISAGLAPDCDFPLMGGTTEDLILVNYEDIDSVTRSSTNKQIIEAITLNTTTDVGYKFEGKNESVEPQANLVKQRYADAYDHEVMFIIFLNTPVAKQQIEKMVHGKLVAVVENKHRNSAGDTSYEVYGLGVGLYVMELNRIVVDADTQGAYKIILRTPDNAKEANLPNPLFITDYPTTKAVVEGLLV
jgi:hypothetical protein